MIELPGETGPEYTCPGDGTFPDMESGCEQYYVCNQGKVRPQDRTHLREVSQWPEKAPARAFSLLKAYMNAFILKNLLRCNAKHAFRYGK